MRRRGGLTLIELLAVIAILAVLAALLFPVFAQSKQQAKIRSCASNLSQLTKATVLYSNDHDDLLPVVIDGSTKETLDKGRFQYTEPWDSELKQAPSLEAVLRPYGPTHETYHCPADISSSETDYFLKYGSSYTYDEIAPLRYRLLGAYPKPSDNALIADAIAQHSPGDASVTYKRLCNCAFADTSVRTMTWVDCTNLFTEPGPRP